MDISKVGIAYDGISDLSTLSEEQLEKKLKEAKIIQEEIKRNLIKKFKREQAEKQPGFLQNIIEKFKKKKNIKQPKKEKQVLTKEEKKTLEATLKKEKKREKFFLEMILTKDVEEIERFFNGEDEREDEEVYHFIENMTFEIVGILEREFKTRRIKKQAIKNFEKLEEAQDDGKTKIEKALKK